jgi:protein-S-isoprenylcysteine O-methyltransferase Ste14
MACQDPGGIYFPAPCPLTGYPPRVYRQYHWYTRYIRTRGTGEYDMRDYGIYVLIVVATVVLAVTNINTAVKSVLDSSNPVIIVPLGIVLAVLIGIVAYFRKITPRRRLYDEGN